MSSLPSTLPAHRIDAKGRERVDLKIIIALAFPFFLNSALNAVLNLTDTWFVARISSDAVAAMGAIYWPSLTLIIFLGGTAIATQTFAAQALGGKRNRRAAHWLWTGIYCGFAVAPAFWICAWGGPWAISKMGLDPNVAKLATEYWQPRMWLAPIGTALWTMLSFINGVGKPRISLAINLFIAVINALLNEVFIFRLGLGIAGSAWATGASIVLGAIATLFVLRTSNSFGAFAFARTWRFRKASFQSLFSLGIPTGLFIAFDLIALSFFQLYQTQLGAVEGAATQIVMMLTSVAYMPAVGIGNAGNTLVAQSIGAGDRNWARKLGNVTIALATLYMGAVGLIIAVGSPLIIPFFTTPNDPQSIEVVKLGVTLAWIAAAYQLFDGLNLGSSFVLRAAGDSKIPAMMLAALAWLVFIPLSQMLTFAPGKTWGGILPGFGYGAAGGWVAAFVYISLLGSLLLWRWRSNEWQKITLR